MKMHYFLISLFLGLLFLTGADAPRSAPAVIAVGDVHGAFDAFVEILQKAGVINAQKKWMAGQSIFILTGDFLDRGARSKDVMDLLMNLEKQSGGRAVVLLGNHEVMNMIGDLRYVTAAEYATYADGRSSSRQAEAYRAYARFLKRRAISLKQQEPVLDAEAEKAWKAAHPPGYVEHREAFGPKGKYGSWLRTKNIVARVADTLFLHGGIHPGIVKLSVDDINAKARKELEMFDTLKRDLEREGVILPFLSLQEVADIAQQELQLQPGSEAFKNRLQSIIAINDWMIAFRDGPLWFRGYDRWSVEEGTPLVKQLTDFYKVKRIVVGHTPQPGKITIRFDSRIALIDTGMLSTHYKGGRASALLIGKDGTLSALYADETTGFNTR